MKCSDCLSKAWKLYDDPRDPPLEVRPCLCNECYQTALMEELDEATQRIHEFNALIKQAKEEAAAHKLKHVKKKSKK